MKEGISDNRVDQSSLFIPGVGLCAQVKLLISLLSEIPFPYSKFLSP